MGRKLQIKGQLIFGQTLKHGEHPTARRRVEKVVGVFDAACDRLKRDELPDVEVGQRGTDVLGRQSCKNRHRLDYQLNSMNLGVSKVERGSAPGRLSTGRSLRFFIVYGISVVPGVTRTSVMRLF